MIDVPKGCIALYHFDNDTIDSYGKTSITTSTASLNTTQSKFGKQSLFFNGTISSGNYIDIPIPNKDMASLSLWFYTLETQTSKWYPTIFSTNCVNNYGGTYVHQNDGAYSIYMCCRANSSSSTGNNNGAYGKTVATANTWHHLAYCKNGSLNYYFLDGELQATVTQNNPVAVTDIFLGVLKKPSSFDSATYFKGYISELMISNAVLWTTSFTPPTESYDTNKLSINGKVRIDDSWKQIKDAYTKIDGVWKQVNTLYSKTENWKN